MSERCKSTFIRSLGNDWFLYFMASLLLRRQLKSSIKAGRSLSLLKMVLNTFLAARMIGDVYNSNKGDGLSANFIIHTYPKAVVGTAIVHYTARCKN